jgi:hypothetical protein
MPLGRSIGIMIVITHAVLAVALRALADSAWIDSSKRTEVAQPPSNEEWLSLFPSMNAITMPSGRLVAVGNDGTVLVSGADPTEQSNAGHQQHTPKS